MSRQPTAAEQEQYLQAMRTQVQQEMAQQLINKMSESCFKVCTGKKGTGLDSSEKACMSNCIGRYMETMGVVSELLAQKTR